MNTSIENKILMMFWDLTPEAKEEALSKLVKDPICAFQDKHLWIKVLSTLTWYEIVQWIGTDDLNRLLNEDIIRSLYPEGKRKYYTHAKRLLSKYFISPAG